MGGDEHIAAIRYCLARLLPRRTSVDRVELQNAPDWIFEAVRLNHVSNSLIISLLSVVRLLRSHKSLASLLRILIIPNVEVSADAKVDHRVSLRHLCHECFLGLSSLDGLQNLVWNLKLTLGQVSQWFVSGLIDTNCVKVVR